MVTRFYLDQSELDDADVGLGGPSPAFVLDTSQLDGDGKLDGVTFTTLGVAETNLGGLSASATGVVVPIVYSVAVAELGELEAFVSQVEVTVAADADALLGALTGAASGTVTVSGSAHASLGSLTALAIGEIDNPGSGDAPLGGLSAVADGDVTIVAEASAGLGEVSTAASGVVTVVSAAAGLLGGVVAVASGTVIPLGTMLADLGELDATAIGTVVPQPTPTPTVQGAGRPYPYRRSPAKKKVEPVVIEVEEVVFKPATVLAYCVPVAASVNASANGSVTFSAEDDDLQVLLML